MSLLNKIIKRQGELLLNRPSFAYAMVFLFAGLPFLTWLSVAIIAFLTLRLGPVSGAKALGVGVFSVLMVNLMLASLGPLQLTLIFFTFVPPFFAAWILRLTASWHTTAIFLILLVSLVVLYAHFFLPAFLLEEYNTLLNLLQAFQKNGVKLKSWVENKEQAINYILGIQNAFLLISSVGSLMVARAFQSRLFYPAGFKKEMLYFQASIFMLIPFCLLLLMGFFYHLPLALGLLPVWVLYFCAAGMSVLICLFAEHRALLVFSLLLIVVSFLPLIMLPLIVCIGALDTLFHFRQRFKMQKNSF